MSSLLPNSSISSGAALATVNIGSTGGPGTMANIQGPISVTNPSALTDLVFHDENDATGQTWTLNNDDGAPSGSVAVTGSATTSYNPFDLGSLTVNAGSGGNTFTVNATSAFYPTTLNTGTGDDTTNVFATGDNTLDIHGQAGQDTVTLGADPVVGMQNLFGTINVDNALGFTDLTLDDSADTTGQTALLFNDGTNGQVTGLSPATINYVDDDTSSLTVFGGSGGNTFTVDGTISNINLSPVLTDLNTGFGDDTTFVEATAAGGPLDVHGQAGPGRGPDRLLRQPRRYPGYGDRRQLLRVHRPHGRCLGRPGQPRLHLVEHGADHAPSPGSRRPTSSTRRATSAR